VHLHHSTLYWCICSGRARRGGRGPGTGAGRPSRGGARATRLGLGRRGGLLAVKLSHEALDRISVGGRVQAVAHLLAVVALTPGVVVMLACASSKQQAKNWMI